MRYVAIIMLTSTALTVTTSPSDARSRYRHANRAPDVNVIALQKEAVKLRREVAAVQAIVKELKGIREQVRGPEPAPIVAVEASAILTPVIHPQIPVPDLSLFSEQPRGPVLASLGPSRYAPLPDKPKDEMAAVNDYLCEVYQRTPVKRDGGGDFTWKDIAAAERREMDVCTYVVGGMNRDLRQALYDAGTRMDADGINWSYLSGFRDDYRQRIASGFKARGGNSRHGGSRATKGYGDGQAIDIACADCSVETVLRWVDRFGRALGLVRPMPGADPSHVQLSTASTRVAVGYKRRHAYRHRHARHHRHHRRYASR